MKAFVVISILIIIIYLHIIKRKLRDISADQKSIKAMLDDLRIRDYGRTLERKP